jgi:hypothetical protein
MCRAPSSSHRWRIAGRRGAPAVARTSPAVPQESSCVARGRTWRGRSAPGSRRRSRRTDTPLLLRARPQRASASGVAIHRGWSTRTRAALRRPRGDRATRVPVLVQHLFAGLTNRTLRPQIAELIGSHTPGQTTYDLRRLRRKGLITGSRKPALRADGLRPADRRLLSHDLRADRQPLTRRPRPQLAPEIANQRPIARA